MVKGLGLDKQDLGTSSEIDGPKAPQLFIEALYYKAQERLHYARSAGHSSGMKTKRRRYFTMKKE